MRRLFLTGVILSIFLPVLANQKLRIKNFDNAALNQLWSVLPEISVNVSEGIMLGKATGKCVRALFIYLSPVIQNMTGYQEQFAANCSVFFEQNITEVNCDFNMLETSALIEDSKRISGVSLPKKYINQLSRTHIMMTQIFADWRVKMQQKLINYLWFKQPPCNTSTHSQTPSRLDSISNSLKISKSFEESLTASWSKSLVLLDTSSQSVSESSVSSNTFSKLVSESISDSKSTTGYHSKSVSETALIVWNPEWANWNVSTGVYEDTTTQTSRYVESITGVIIDTFTGLQWEKIENLNTSWPEAAARCKHLVKGGFTDWRLPTRVELQSLVDYVVNNPAINTVAFPNTTPSLFWSSTNTPPYFLNSWHVDFIDGKIGATGDTNRAPYSRCVRPASADRIVERYFDEESRPLTNESTQVKDVVTGLIWQRFVAETIFNTPKIARAFCANLTVANRHWVLPRIKELSTLLDIGIRGSEPMINITAFPDTPKEGFWSDTSQSSGPNTWTLDFGSGYSLFLNRAPYYVRCLRSDSLFPTPAPVPVTPSPAVLPGSEMALWNASTGVYFDTASEASRFTSTSGIVTDLYTGLQWQAVGSSEQYPWSAARTSGSAQIYCTNQTTGDFQDWRLPTNEELQTLVDYTKNSPAIDTEIFSNTQSHGYWSSTVYHRDATSAWVVNFVAGLVYYNAIGGLYYVRCVRAGSNNGPAERYTDENGAKLTKESKQVKDIVTGFIWQRDFDAMNQTWSASAAPGSAQAYCNQLVIGSQGVRAWRLPAIKELRTLVDLTRSPVIDITAFPNTNYDWFWTSTAYDPDSTNAWVVSFYDGHVPNEPSLQKRSVRCMRFNNNSSVELSSRSISLSLEASSTNFVDDTMSDSRTNSMSESHSNPCAKQPVSNCTINPDCSWCNGGHWSQLPGHGFCYDQDFALQCCGGAGGEPILCKKNELCCRPAGNPNGGVNTCAPEENHCCYAPLYATSCPPGNDCCTDNINFAWCCPTGKCDNSKYKSCLP